jgi:hypothetical protein
MTVSVPPSDPHLADAFSRHPRVDTVTHGRYSDRIEFQRGDWARQLFFENPHVLTGLTELMDNNPLVCADEASVLPTAAVLPSLALGPLALAGLLQEPPVVLTNAKISETDLSLWLRFSAWDQGVTLSGEVIPMNGVLSCTCIALVPNLDDPTEIDDLFEERYGKSLYIRRNEDSEWDTRLVQNQPFAVYRLRWTPGEKESLLTVQAMADTQGKCGSGQIIHMFNVMNGFEESLGIS